MRDKDIVPVSDVIKAMECCMSSKYVCNICPYKEFSVGCGEKLHGDLFELVKRQQAEIEELKRTIPQSVCD